MKGSDQFKKTIQAHLESVAQNDEAFAVKFQNPNKNIDDCITYILNTVKNSGAVGFADSEIYGMALHYYDEEDVKAGPKVTSGSVVVNHTVELTEEDKAAAKKKALDDLAEQEKKKLLAKAEKAKAKKPTADKDQVQPSLFD